MTEILIFRTNVDCQEAVRQLAPLLNSHLAISKWNFDLEDCDKILRVEARNNASGEILEILRCKGFDCEELPYQL